tara:strand:+ start:3754 stop:4107 length:354 start_codon:yes stop_codon:yes gene_type:complete
MKDIMDTLFCVSCGTCNPEYKVIKGMKVCKGCRNFSALGAVLSVYEMIDIFNDLQVQKVLPEGFFYNTFSDRLKQSCDNEEIDFDDDLLSVEQAIAREDAMRDMLYIDDIYDSDEEY